MDHKDKNLDYLLIALVLLMIFVGLTFTAAQFISYKRELVRQEDIQSIRQELAKTAPADVLAKVSEVLLQNQKLIVELKEAREEFNSSRFTHADGKRMDQRINQLIKENALKDTSSPQRNP